MRQGGRGATTLYCKWSSSLSPRALQLIHPHSHKEKQTGCWLVRRAGVEHISNSIPREEKGQSQRLLPKSPSQQEDGGCKDLLGAAGEAVMKASPDLI